MIFRFLPFLLFFIPSMTLSEVGFRDLKVGGPYSIVEEHCQKLSDKYMCYGNDEYIFDFESVDGQILSEVDISPKDVGDLPPLFYLDEGSKFWEIRNNLLKKYTLLECEEKSFKKLVLGENDVGIEFYVFPKSDDKFDWISFMVMKNYLGEYYSWSITYNIDNPYKDKTMIDIYIWNCGTDSFRNDEF